MDIGMFPGNGRAEASGAAPGGGINNTSNAAYRPVFLTIGQIRYGLRRRAYGKTAPRAAFRKARQQSSPVADAVPENPSVAPTGAQVASKS